MSDGDSDRRIHFRRPFPTTGSNPVVVTVGVIPRAALLCDLSANGVGLLTTDPPPVGSIVPLWLAIPAGSPSRLVLLRVVFSLAVANDLYRVGLNCLDEGGMAVFHELLSSSPESGSAGAGSSEMIGEPPL